MKYSVATIAIIASVAFAGPADLAVKAAGKVAVDVITAAKTDVAGSKVENDTEIAGGEQKARGAFNTINNGVSFKSFVNGAKVVNTKVDNKSKLDKVKQNADGFSNQANNGVTF